MSFSGEVKEELAVHVGSARHCQLAELSAIIHYCGRIEKNEQYGDILLLETENEAVLRKCFTLLKKTFNIDSLTGEKDDFQSKQAVTVDKRTIILTDHDTVWEIFMALKIVDGQGVFHGFSEPVSSVLIKNECCRRAFLRGVFLCIGSMSDPEKGYHLEMAADTRSKAQQIQEVLRDFQIEAKIIMRKKYYVVYLKEGSCIVDFLNICGAHVSLMNLENLRIVKEMRNTINRRVNCEAANITKTVTAAAKQIEDITRLRDQYGLSNLPENLSEIAQVRLEHPDATLKELGLLLSPPVGKSGVNHRLRKLSEIAEGVRV